MSRDGSGTYSLPLPVVVTGATIEASWANTTLSDLATALTDSLSRSGSGGMSAALKGVDGTKTIPAFSFSSESTTGFYRSGAGDLRASASNTDVARFHTSNGLQTWNGGAWVDVVSFDANGSLWVG